MSQSTVEITGTGTADAKFTKVTYAVRVAQNGRTGPEAKERARPIIENVLKVLKEHADQAGIDPESIKSLLSVEEVSSYDHNTRENVFGGYRASYSLTFSGSNVDEASKLHDALTSIDDARASSPAFEIGSNDELLLHATTRAFAAANSRFRMECEVLGLDPDDYEIRTWSTGHDHGTRAKSLGLEAAVAMDAPMAAPIEIRAGKAVRSVTLTVSYARKATDPVISG